MWIIEYFSEKAIRKFAATASAKRQFAEVAKEEIPVLIVAFNNGVYVENMVSQLNSYGIRPLIIDNASTQEKTIGVFSKLEKSDSALYVKCPKTMAIKLFF